MAWQCLDKIVMVAGGCLVAATGGLEPGTGVGAAVGLAGLLGFFGQQIARHGPESQAYLSKIQAAVVKELGDPPEWPGETSATVSGWEWSLGQALPHCFLDRRTLAASIFDREGFPVVAARLVLKELKSREPIFSEAPARDFAHRVISAALTAAYEDKEYFESLAPYLWAELGLKMDRLAVHSAAISIIGNISVFMRHTLPSKLDSKGQKLTNDITQELMIYIGQLRSLGLHIGENEKLETENFVSTIVIGVNDIFDEIKRQAESRTPDIEQVNMVHRYAVDKIEERGKDLCNILS